MSRRFGLALWRGFEASHARSTEQALRMALVKLAVRVAATCGGASGSTRFLLLNIKSLFLLTVASGTVARNAGMFKDTKQILVT